MSEPREDEGMRGFIPPPMPFRNRPVRPPSPPLSSWEAVGQFFGGLLGGAVVSAFAWFVGWKSELLLQFALGGLAIKFAVGIAFLFVRGRKLIGAGVLVSIALGIMIVGAGAVYILVTCKFN
jgi:hypothetical protein